MPATERCHACGVEFVVSESTEGQCPACGSKRPARFSQSDLVKTAVLSSAVSWSFAAQKNGNHFGAYEIIEELGRGGMGVVYRARHVSNDRIVALKMLPPGSAGKAEFIKRFWTEATAAASLSHPNIVAIHDIGEEEGLPYFAMEYVTGHNLADLVHDKPLPAVRAARYVRVLAEAIHYAHEHGILHRDLKPSNVIIDPADQPHITDFGIAKRLSDQTEITLTGQMLGSPAYLPPEQASSQPGEFSPASDVYSLGAILYHLLTGRPCFLAETLEATLMQVLGAEPVPPRLLNPNIPRPLDIICLKCLEKDPKRRYVSARDLALELGRFLRGERIETRPVSATEKFYRWCRANPLASSFGFAVVFLLLALAIGSLMVALRVSGARAREIHERERMERALSTLERQRAQEQFVSDDASAGVAYLAGALRRNPNHAAVARRLMSALSLRRFAVPATIPMVHTGKVNFVEVSADGRFIATASADNTARVWDARTGKGLTAPLRHDGPVLSAMFTRDSSRVVTASEDKSARVWETITGRLLVPRLEHAAEVMTAEFSPDARWIVTASWDKTARIWEAQTGQPAGQALRHEDLVWMAHFSPDGETVITASEDKTARVWDWKTGQLRFAPLAHSGYVRSARFSPDGRWIATASYDGTARIWDAHTGKPRGDPLRHKGPVVAALFSADSRKLLTLSIDRTARLWEVPEGRELAREIGLAALPVAGQFSPDGESVLIGCDNGMLRLWRSASGEPASEKLILSNPITALSFNPSGGFVVASDDSARRWQFVEHSIGKVHFDHSQRILAGHFSPDGRKVVTVSEDRRAVVWDAISGAILAGPFEHAGSVLAARFSPDGRLLATGSSDKTARIWSLENGQPLLPPLKHDGPVVSICFSPDGNHLLTASGDKLARVWTCRTGELAIGPLRHDRELYGANFSPDGRWILTACDDGAARVWNSRTGELASKPLRHGAAVYDASFSFDGVRVITASADKTAVIWDWRKGKPLTEPLQHRGYVRSVRFSPDGRLALTASADGTARVWDVITGLAVAEPLQHRAEVTAAEFDATGELVVTSSRDGTIRIWAAETGGPVSEIMPQGSEVFGAEFNPAGDQVLALAGNSARISEIHRAPLPVPSWFIDFAEAVGGQRLNYQGVLEPITAAALWDLEQKARAKEPAGFYERWVQRFFREHEDRKLGSSTSAH